MSADCEESCGASSSAGSLDILLGRKRSCSRTSHETKERPANIRTSTVGQSAGQQHRCSVIQSPGLPEPSRAVVFPPSHVSASHTIPFLPIRPSAGPLLGPTETRRLYLSIFVDGYLQQEAHASPAVTLQSEQWISPDLPSMQAAVDVVSLLQLNALKHDDRILLEARKRHAAMLRCFRHESQTRQIDLASIIKTMQLMLVGEVYSAVSGGPHAWMQLVSNIVDMVDEQGPSLLLKPFGGMLTKLARICGVSQPPFTKADVDFCSRK